MLMEDELHYDDDDENGEFEGIVNETDIINPSKDCDYDVDYNDMAARFESFLSRAQLASPASSPSSNGVKTSAESAVDTMEMETPAAPAAVIPAEVRRSNNNNNFCSLPSHVTKGTMEKEMESNCGQKFQISWEAEPGMSVISSSSGQQAQRSLAAGSTAALATVIQASLAASSTAVPAAVIQAEVMRANNNNNFYSLPPSSKFKFDLDFHEQQIVVSDEDEAGAGEKDTRDDGTFLFEYPGGSESVRVSITDYMTLQHGEWLNDTIIEFYLKFLFLEVLAGEHRSSVHLFSSRFYKRMYEVRGREDAGMTSAQRKHSRVKRWTKSVNLFEKEFIIFPICEGSHWFLIVAILPRLATLAPGSAGRRGGGEPQIMLLDSLNRPQADAVADIRSYLAMEWAARGGGGNHTFDSRVMKTHRPSRKPEQQNGDDCGIYLLYYIEQMFTR